MLAGMSKEEKQIFDLATASDYVYLNQVNPLTTIMIRFKLTCCFSWMERSIVIVEMMEKNGQRSKVLAKC